MKRFVHHYEKALVPEHLTKLTIEKLPLEKAYFVSPGDRESYEETAIFVSPDRRLMMSRTYAIDSDDARVSSPIGRVGISRIVLMDFETMKPRQAFIADLRFLEDHQLVDSDEMNEEMGDQEEFMEAVATLNNAVPFDAFIALERGEEIDKNIPKGTFYGDPQLHPHLKKLRKKGNKAVRRFWDPIVNPKVESGAQSASNDTAESSEEKHSSQHSVEQDVPL